MDGSARPPPSGAGDAFDRASPRQVTGPILLALAFAGGLALVSRLLRSAAKLALSSATAVAEGGLAEVSARRGDLTALDERRRAEREALRARRRNGIAAAAWLAWLALPPFFSVAPEAYALAAALWLLPGTSRVRPPRPSTPAS